MAFVGADMKVPPTEDEENTIPLLYVAVPLKVGVEDVFELLSIHVVTVAPVAGGVPVPAGSAPSSQRRHPVILVGTNEVGRPIFVIGIYLVNDDVFIIIYLILTCRIIPRCLYHRRLYSEDIRLDTDLICARANGGDNDDETLVIRGHV